MTISSKKQNFHAIRGHYKTNCLAKIDWIDVFNRIREKSIKQSPLAKSLGVNHRSFRRLYSKWNCLSIEDQSDPSCVELMGKGKQRRVE